MKSNLPNFLIAGTPGTGKTTICNKLIEKLKDDYQHLNISDYAKENNLCDEFDEKRNCFVINDDKLIDHIGDLMKETDKSIIFDYHGCDLFETDWIKAIFVLRTSNDQLYQRLQARNYCESKITENIECEIFQVILDEAKEAFEDEDVEIIELENNTEEDQLENIKKILDWIRSKV